jgi:hypothetical protein
MTCCKEKLIAKRVVVAADDNDPAAALDAAA